MIALPAHGGSFLGYLPTPCVRGPTSPVDEHSPSVTVPSVAASSRNSPQQTQRLMGALGVTQSDGALPDQRPRLPLVRPSCRPTVRHCRATATPTCASSAPATPGCGRRTTSSAPTRRCASRAGGALRRVRRLRSQRRLAVGAGARGPPPDGEAARPRPGGGLAAGTQRRRRRGHRRRRRAKASTRASSRAAPFRSRATVPRRRGCPRRSTKSSAGRSMAIAR